MAADMEQHRAPELAAPESSPQVMTKPASAMDEHKPAMAAAKAAELAWSDAGLHSLKTRPTTPGGSALKVETANVQTSSSLAETLDPDGLKSLLPKPSDGLPVPTLNCDSASPVSPTVMKDLQFDSRFISDTWSYEAPQNMYALLTQPTGQLDALSNGAGLVTPYMQLQTQQLQLQQHQQQLDQQLEHGLPLQLSPIHGSGLASLYMTGTPLAISPQHIMMQSQSQSGGNTSSASTAAYPTTPTAVNLGDIMISGDTGLFLPSASPTNLAKNLAPPMASSGHSTSGVMNVKDLTLNELRPHFNKPMAVVAKELGVCITLMKKICRRNGLVRWPHRRIRSLVNRITSLQVLAGNAAGAERKRFQSQIAALREELSAVIQNPNEKSRKAQADSKIRSPIEMMAELSQEAHAEFFSGQVKDELVVPDIHADVENSVKKSKKKKSKIKTESTKRASARAEVNSMSTGDVSEYGDDVPRDIGTVSGGTRSKKRKQPFRASLQAHQPPPIKIPRHDELPSMTRLRSQSVPERRLRGERRYGRGRDNGPGATCERPATTTHRNGRRGSISSILCDIAE
ncbi:hypothetical protein PHYBOEH_003848 [Phytophthora boehmeriae]|uniref:RWP-RK domain-containing protein n=1 Tax=Phytophthora boehmeriae TaxID=109152 RepID=A0A8T1X4D6_9STRA|nr:hypothetical protein PHYBOEH_003848 [Phytophthora boehmeriae]